MGLTHLTGGAATGVWLAVAVRPTPLIAGIGVVLGAATAMTPDLDHPEARAVRRLGPVGWALCRLIRFLSRLATGVEHRGLSHSLLFALLIGCLTLAVSRPLLVVSHAEYLALVAGLGVVSALAGDAVTKASLRHVFWPLRIDLSVPRLLRITTGGPVEKWVVLPLVSVAVAAGVLAFAWVTITGLTLGVSA